MKLLQSISRRANILTEMGMDPTADFPPHVVDQIMDMATEHLQSGEAESMEQAVAISLMDADLPGLDSEEDVARAVKNIMAQVGKA